MVVVNKSTVPIGSGNWVGSLVRESYEQHHGAKAGRTVLRGFAIPNFCAKARRCTIACIRTAW